MSEHITERDTQVMTCVLANAEPLHVTKLAVKWHNKVQRWCQTTCRGSGTHEMAPTTLNSHTVIITPPCQHMPTESCPSKRSFSGGFFFLHCITLYGNILPAWPHIWVIKAMQFKYVRYVERELGEGFTCASAGNPAEVFTDMKQSVWTWSVRMLLTMNAHAALICEHVAPRFSVRNQIVFGCSLEINEIYDTHTHTHRHHPIGSLHVVNVSHVFPYSGHFLHHRCHIKQHSVFPNFCQMTQCYVIPELFQLESTAWH